MRVRRLIPGFTIPLAAAVAAATGVAGGPVSPAAAATGRDPGQSQACGHDQRDDLG